MGKHKPPSMNPPSTHPFFYDVVPSSDFFLDISTYLKWRESHI